MTRLKIEKILFLLLFLLLATGSALGKTKSKEFGPEIYLTAGVIPVYHFSIKPDGGDYNDYHFTGPSLQGEFCYRTRRITTRLGLSWNILFLAGSQEKEVINMLSPSLSVIYHFKKYFYGGMGLAGMVVPGTIKLGGNSYDTHFDLWFSLSAGLRFPINNNLYLITELKYNLNITLRQWSDGTDSGGTPFSAETRTAQLVALYGGVSFPFSW